MNLVKYRKLIYFQALAFLAMFLRQLMIDLGVVTTYRGLYPEYSNPRLLVASGVLGVISTIVSVILWRRSKDAVEGMSMLDKRRQSVWKKD